MARYMVINSHRPEDCVGMEADLDKIPPVLKGLDFFCTCPFGEHGFHMFLQGESSEEVLALLPPSLRNAGQTRAVPYEVWQL